MGSLLIMGVMMGVMGVVGLGSLWKSKQATANAPAFAVSPVGGRRLAVTPATPRAVVEGKTYYFEDEEQQRAFVSDPDRSRIR